MYKVRNVCFGVRKELYETVRVPAVTYEADTWVWGRRRHECGETWMNRVRSEEVSCRVSVKRR